MTNIYYGLMLLSNRLQSMKQEKTLRNLKLRKVKRECLHSIIQTFTTKLKLFGKMLLKNTRMLLIQAKLFKISNKKVIILSIKWNATFNRLVPNSKTLELLDYLQKKTVTSLVLNWLQKMILIIQIQLLLQHKKILDIQKTQDCSRRCTSSMEPLHGQVESWVCSSLSYSWYAS